MEDERRKMEEVGIGSPDKNLPRTYPWTMLLRHYDDFVVIPNPY